MKNYFFRDGLLPAALVFLGYIAFAVFLAPPLTPIHTLEGVGFALLVALLAAGSAWLMEH